jgi:hypothetical protein
LFRGRTVIFMKLFYCSMRTFVFLCFITTFLNLSAQEKVAEQKIGWRGGGLQLHSISDKTKKQICNVIVSADSLKVFILNPDLKWKEAFTFPRRPYEKLFGGFFKDDKVYLFLDNGQQPGLPTGYFICRPEN